MKKKNLKSFLKEEEGRTPLYLTNSNKLTKLSGTRNISTEKIQPENKKLPEEQQEDLNNCNTGDEEIDRKLSDVIKKFAKSGKKVYLNNFKQIALEYSNRIGLKSFRPSFGAEMPNKYNKH